MDTLLEVVRHPFRVLLLIFGVGLKCTFFFARFPYSLSIPRTVMIYTLDIFVSHSSLFFVVAILDAFLCLFVCLIDCFLSPFILLFVLSLLLLI